MVKEWMGKKPASSKLRRAKEDRGQRSAISLVASVCSCLSSLVRFIRFPRHQNRPSGSGPRPSAGISEACFGVFPEWCIKYSLLREVALQAHSDSGWVYLSQSSLPGSSFQAIPLTATEEPSARASTLPPTPSRAVRPGISVASGQRGCTPCHSQGAPGFDGIVKSRSPALRSGFDTSPRTENQVVTAHTVRSP